MPDDPVLWHSQADWESPAAPTGRLRWKSGTLQQEWSCRWGNNMGEQVALEWFDVPTEDDAPDR